MLELRTSSQGVLLRVKVAPRASATVIERVEGGELRVRLAAPPVDGKANKALLGLLADALGLPPRDLAIAAGATSRHKTVAIAHLSEAQVRERLATVLGPAAAEDATG